MPQGLHGARPVEPRCLVDRGGDAGQARLEEQADVADVLPERHEGHGGQRERGVGQPFHAHAEQLVERAGGRLQDPAPHDAEGERRAHPRQHHDHPHHRGARQCPHQLGGQYEPQGEGQRHRDEREHGRDQQGVGERAVGEQGAVVLQPHEVAGAQQVPVEQGHREGEHHGQHQEADHADRRGRDEQPAQQGASRAHRILPGRSVATGSTYSSAPFDGGARSRDVVAPPRLTSPPAPARSPVGPPAPAMSGQDLGAEPQGWCGGVPGVVSKRAVVPATAHGSFRDHSWNERAPPLPCSG